MRDRELSLDATDAEPALEVLVRELCERRYGGRDVLSIDLLSPR